MRPGQLTPENGEILPHPVRQPLASMRPGQLTPENNDINGMYTRQGELQ